MGKTDSLSLFPPEVSLASEPASDPTAVEPRIDAAHASPAAVRPAAATDGAIGALIQRRVLIRSASFNPEGTRPDSLSLFPAEASLALEHAPEARVAELPIEAAQASMDSVRRGASTEVAHSQQQISTLRQAAR